MSMSIDDLLPIERDALKLVWQLTPEPGYVRIGRVGPIGRSLCSKGWLFRARRNGEAVYQIPSALHAAVREKWPTK